ncbi:hypothetical protein QVA66_10980 [Staphylococcus chromogenes]|nr:hypothetical protein [Staphylococcus chromogenes]
MTFADPAMQASPELDGAWYIHPEYDFIQHIARVVVTEAERLEIDPARILFYGSSLGAFGAIACAAHIPGARAIADVPQIDVENWEDRHVALIEEYILGEKFSAFRQKYPERLNLHSRLEFAGRIPQIRLTTNPLDSSYQDQLDFFQFAQESNLPSGGVDLLITTRLKGHTFFDQDELIPSIVP